MITFGIVIATYYRSDGSTFGQLSATLKSVIDQTYPYWKVYLIGDKYEDEEEFFKLQKIIPKDKLYSINLDTSERYLPGLTPKRKWQIGGTNSFNAALEKQRSDNIKVTCHLDDDDIWNKKHLAVINSGYTHYPESVFVFTRGANFGEGTPAKFKNKLTLPRRDDIEIGYDNYPPRRKFVYHSTVSWNLKEMPLNYEIHKHKSTDSFMWMRVAEYCKNQEKKTLYIPKITVRKRWNKGAVWIEEKQNQNIIKKNQK